MLLEVGIRDSEELDILQLILLVGYNLLLNLKLINKKYCFRTQIRRIIIWALICSKLNKTCREAELA